MHVNRPRAVRLVLLKVLAFTIVLVSSLEPPLQAWPGDKPPRMEFCIVASTAADEPEIRKQQEAIARAAKEGKAPSFLAKTTSGGTDTKPKTDVASRVAALVLPRIGLSDVVAGSLLPKPPASSAATQSTTAGYRWVLLDERAGKILIASPKALADIKAARKEKKAVVHPLRKYLIYSPKGKEYWVLVREPRPAERITETHLKFVRPGYTDEDGPLVYLLFDDTAKEHFAKFTGDAIKQAGNKGACHLAIVREGKVLQIARFGRAIDDGRLQISGQLDREGARKLAGELKALLNK